MVLRGGTMSVCGKIVKDIKGECHFERVNDVQIVCLRRPTCAAPSLAYLLLQHLFKLPDFLFDLAGQVFDFAFCF